MAIAKAEEEAVEHSPSRAGQQQRRAATRERLLDAARRVFARAGYHGASVEEIASEADFTTGALYSNFAGKADLFLSLMEREIDRHARQVSQVAGRLDTVSARAAGGAREWMRMVEREPELVLLFAEFWAYGVRDPEMRPQVAQRLAHVRSLITRMISSTVRDLGLELSVPAEHLAVAIDALADGIARQKLADPEAIPDDLLGNVVAMLLAGATGGAPDEQA